MTYDLAIIGGGPGGSSAAITAARLGKSVLLLEAGSFPRQKVCGEFVSGESLHLLSELLGPEAFCDAPVISEARFFSHSGMITTRIPAAARSITRWQMDEALWLAAKGSGAEARVRTPVLRVSGKSEFLIHTATEDFSARGVIQAAGRWSRLNQYAVPAGPRWLGIKAHFHEPDPARSCDLYFFRGGYCGVQPIAKDAVNVCAMVRSDRAVTMQDIFTLHPQLAARAEGWQQMIETVTTAPLVFRQPTPVRDNLLCVGDAAAFVDPFVGDGISIALHTGRMAAEAVSHLPVAEALTHYAREYQARVVPALRNARFARRALGTPDPLRSWVFRLLANTGLANGLGAIVVSRTRVRAA